MGTELYSKDLLLMLVLFQVKAYFCILLFDFIIVYIKRVTFIQQFASDTSKCITSCESEVTHPESVIRVAVKCSQLEAEKFYQGQILIIQNILTLKYKKKMFCGPFYHILQPSELTQMETKALIYVKHLSLCKIC